MGNHAAIIRQRVQADHPGATVRRRGMRFIEHTLPDGRVQWTGSIERMHYGPTSEQEIDTTWRPAIAPDAWIYNQGPYTVTARPTFNVGQIITVTHSSGQSITFQPQPLEYSNNLDQIYNISIPLPVVATPDDATLNWIAAYGAGLNMNWVVLPTKLLKQLTITNFAALPVPPPYIFDGGNPYLRLEFIFSVSSNVDIWIDGILWNRNANNPRNTDRRIEFRHSQTNELLWVFIPATVTDAGDNVVSGTRTYVRRQGNNLFVSVRVPYTVLQNAVYPLVIDPTYNEQPDATAGLDTYVSSTSPTWAGGGIYSRWLGGEKTGVTEQTRGFVKFDLSSIPGSATLSSVTFTGWTYKDGTNYADHNSANPIYRLKDGRDWGETETTWNQYKSGSNWSTAGADNTTSDRDSTAIGIWNGLQSDPEFTEKTSSWNIAQTTEWVNETRQNNGVVFTGLTNNNDLYAVHSSDHTTAGQRPKLTIVYTTGTHYTITAATGSYTLTGNATGLAYGHKFAAVSGTYAVTGQATNFVRGYSLAAAAATYAVTGNSVGLSRGLQLTADTATYTVTGQAALITAQRTITAATTNYTLAGNVTGLAHGYSVLAATGTYTYTGQAALLTAQRVLTADTTSYTYTGFAVSLPFGYSLLAATSIYAVTGNAAILTADRNVSLVTGTYTYTGQATGLSRGYPLVATSGTYTLTGQATGLARGFGLAASQGAYTATGNDAALTATRELLAATATYALTGQATGLAHGHKLVADTATYTVTGNATGIARGLSIAAVSGTYALTGNALTFTQTRALLASSGTYALTGQDTNLVYSGTTYYVLAAAGTYAHTGQATGLAHGFAVGASSGTYAVTGQATGLVVARQLPMAAGTYTYTGNAVIPRVARSLTAASSTYTQTGNATSFLVAYMLAAITATYTYTGRSVILDYSEAESTLADVTVIDNLLYTVTITDTGVTVVTLSDASMANIALSDISRG